MSADQPSLLPEVPGESFAETIARYVDAASQAIEQVGAGSRPDLLGLITDLETLTRAPSAERSASAPSPAPPPTSEGPQATEAAEAASPPTPVVVPASIGDDQVRAALARWSATRTDLPEQWASKTDFVVVDSTWWEVELRWLTGRWRTAGAKGPGSHPPAHMRLAPEVRDFEQHRPPSVRNMKQRFMIPGSHVASACTDCGASGSTRCDGCNGYGALICGACNGDKVVSCPTTVRCDECGGSGRVRSRSASSSGARVSCRACQGDGQRSCPDCRGRGQRPCDSCRQQGQVRCGQCEGAGKVTCSECDGTGTASTWKEAVLTWTAHDESVATPAVGRKLGAPAHGEGSTWTSPKPDPKLDELLAPRKDEVVREVSVTAHPLAKVTYEGPDGPEVLWVGGTDGVVEAPAIDARKRAEEAREAAEEDRRRRSRMTVVLFTILAVGVAAAAAWALLT